MKGKWIGVSSYGRHGMTHVVPQYWVRGSVATVGCIVQQYLSTFSFFRCRANHVDVSRRSLVAAL